MNHVFFYEGWTDHIAFLRASKRARPRQPQCSKWISTWRDYWPLHVSDLFFSLAGNCAGWWVKVGQFLSTRSDLLPQQYIHHLIKLQDMMPTTPYPVIEKTLERELGRAQLRFHTSRGANNRHLRRDSGRQATLHVAYSPLQRKGPPLLGESTTLRHDLILSL